MLDCEKEEKAVEDAQAAFDSQEIVVAAATKTLELLEAILNTAIEELKECQAG